METAEIRQLLMKMNALIGEEGDEHVESLALSQDPIVSNRLAVELLQQIDPEAKPELVLAPSGAESYFGYSVALSAWMRFGACEQQEGQWNPSLDIKKKEKVVIVLDTFDEDRAHEFITLVKEKGAKPVAILSLIGGPASFDKVACHSLL